MESKHPEGGESPFIIKDDAASVAALIEYDSGSNDDYVLCPVDGCGEALMLAELESHVEMHEEEQDTGNSEVLSSRSPKRLKLDPEIKNSFSSKLSYALRNIGDPDDERPVSDVPSPDRNASVKDAWKKVLKMPESSSSKAASANMIDGPKPVRRRLGVSPPSSGYMSRESNSAAEVGAGSPSCREADARMASQGPAERR
jgi:hypothetical protein